MTGEINKCYGSQIARTGSLNMAGGCAEWWNYHFKFDDYDYTLYIEDRDGLHELDNVVLYYNTDTEDIRRCEADSAHKPNEDEVEIDAEFFEF